MFCLNKAKGAYSIAKIVDSILIIAEDNSWSIRVEHIPGVNNNIPDSLSRLCRAGDYALRREILSQALIQLNLIISIDLFANRSNRQV
jgi:hypothetical protein